MRRGGDRDGLIAGVQTVGGAGPLGVVVASRRRCGADIVDLANIIRPKHARISLTREPGL
ncbi:hypothetical protein GCM10020216_030710 [Nonomuraea helvata]